MTLLQSLKPFWPLIFTFLLPRTINYYQALKLAYRTRPPPRPLPAKASYSEAILFFACQIFGWLAITLSSHHLSSNIFARTKTRLHVPTEVLFNRLAAGNQGGLTPTDEALKLKLTSLPLRYLYLRYGANTILDCQFCHPDNPLTYAIHHLPTNILVPHLLEFLTIGLVTSRTICGPIPSQFRLKATIGAILLLLLDIYISYIYEPGPIDPNQPSPFSLHYNTSIYRPCILIVYNILLGFSIHFTATNRFIFFPFLASSTSSSTETNPEELMTKTQSLLSETHTNLAMTQMKLRGLNVTKNAIVRDSLLKSTEDRYWDTVRRMETDQGLGMGLGLDDQAVFEDEDVQRALAGAFGSGNVDVSRMRREAEGFVREVTRGLDDSNSAGAGGN